MNASSRVRRFALGFSSAALLAGALALLVAQCNAPKSDDRVASKADAAAGIEAWSVVYDVLQHPRCVNCHPAGNVPLQGEDGHPHAQDVQRGDDGKGRFALRCATCHQDTNLPGAHLPPGGPDWKLPERNMPLVFEGKSRGDLCRQLRDRARNGNQSGEELFHHVAEAPLVLWGWKPGDGRAPVPISHADLVRAMRAWVDSDCACPDS